MSNLSFYLLIRPKRKPTTKQSEADKRRYANLDKLRNYAFISPQYKLIFITDKVMGIPTHKVLHSNARSKQRYLFKKDLGFNFKIGLFSFRRDGSIKLGCDLEDANK